MLKETIIKDNSKEVIKSVAQYILDKADCNFLSQRELDRLHKYSTYECSDTYFDLTFTDKSSNANYSIFVDLKTVGESLTDEEENFWQRKEVYITVSWGSYNSMSVALGMQHLEFMSKIASFANEIQNSFQEPVYELISTKAQREEREKHLQYMIHSKEVKRLTEEICKGIRVGTTRQLKLETSVADGDYDVTLNSKSYKVTVSKNEGQRTSTFIFSRLE